MCIRLARTTFCRRMVGDVHLAKHVSDETFDLTVEEPKI